MYYHLNIKTKQEQGRAVLDIIHTCSVTIKINIQARTQHKSTQLASIDTSQEEILITQPIMNRTVQTLTQGSYMHL